MAYPATLMFIAALVSRSCQASRSGYCQIQTVAVITSPYAKIIPDATSVMLMPIIKRKVVAQHRLFGLLEGL